MVFCGPEFKVLGGLTMMTSWRSHEHDRWLRHVLLCRWLQQRCDSVSQLQSLTLLTGLEYHIVCSTDLNDTLPYTTTGNGLTMMSNRLSWFYDIRGPSMTLDTACSSSLVALSLAVQNIRDSKSTTRQSLVAGSNLILLPDQMTAMNPLNFLSPDSQCYSFDERANGYVRGEGVGVVLLKHIDDARRDGDYIRGVIRNVVCNQDGKTPGITLPSSDAQVSLIRQAYESAGLGLDETGYFEAHGTGTGESPICSLKL